MFKYLENGFFGYTTFNDIIKHECEMLLFKTIEFDETTGLPLPLPKNTARTLEVEMLEHEGFTPCNLLGRSMCMKIKVLCEVQYNLETYELTNEPNK